VLNEDKQLLSPHLIQSCFFGLQVAVAVAVAGCRFQVAQVPITFWKRLVDNGW